MKIIPVVYAQKRRLFKGAVNGFLPRIVTVPLVQEKGCRCRCLVKKGDIVREGEVIAVPDADFNSAYPAKIHSSVPGTVEDIVLCTGPDGRQEKAVKIKTGGSFSYLGRKQHAADWTSLSAGSLIKQFADRGVINTFNTVEPVSLASEIESKKNKKNRLLVVRMYDEDPSRVTDSKLSTLYTDDVHVGALITAHALGAAGIVFVCDAKSDLLRMASEDGIPVEVVKVNITEYPAGFQKEIRKCIKKNLNIPPFSSVSAEDLYTDASTMVDVCDVVKYGIPVVEKFVYVSGDCVPASGLLKVRLGTSMRFLAQQCGGFTQLPAAVIVNGLMRGCSAGSLDAPVAKYVKSVSFLPQSKVLDQRQYSCIQCGLCRTVCPRKLTPDVLYRHASGGMEAGEEYVRSAKLCSCCGLCNFVCPARLPISQAVKLLKMQEISKEAGYVQQ
jgi:Na+-translocating ferredoxin:NAD+ oxidoreductase subunit C